MTENVCVCVCVCERERVLVYAGRKGVGRVGETLQYIRSKLGFRKLGLPNH